MERDCESELSKLNIEQNACIYHFGASVIHGQRSNILRLLLSFENENEKWIDFVCACRKGLALNQKYDIVLGNVRMMMYSKQ